jgi:hypothetical protein
MDIHPKKRIAMPLQGAIKAQGKANPVLTHIY